MSYDYRRVLSETQDYLSQNYSSLLTRQHKYEEVHTPLCRRIRACLQNRFAQALEESGEELVERIFEDQVGFGCLAKYLRHLDAPEYKELYEINGNRWDDIVLKFQSGEVRFLKEHFLSPQHARDVMQRIADDKDVRFDNIKAYAELDIEQNIRHSAFAAPLIEENAGASFSIRIIRTAQTGNLYFVPAALSEQMEQFLFACVRYRIPFIIGGEPGSGKTVLLNHLLSAVERRYRIGAIEVNSRELVLEGKQFVSLLANGEYSPDDLLYGALRQDFNYIIPQEMRGEEAYTAIEAAHTGMIATTIHVAAMRLIWGRCATLARKKVRDDTASLTNYAMEAFPVAVYMQRGRDNRFRVMEIAEGIRYDRQTDTPVYQPLYHFRTEKNVVEGGSTKVIGEFEPQGGISENLRELFRSHGAPEDLIHQFAVGG